MDKTYVFKSVLIGTLIVVCFCGCGKSTTQYVNVEEPIEKSIDETTVEEDMESTQMSEVADEMESLLYVYVCGEVNVPGVYTLSAGSRVCDVFEMAGGFTPNAATDYWNQARVLADGEMIYVPTLEEAKERVLEENGGSDILGQRDSDNTEGKVNINTASKHQLMTIPGIGEAKADAIIAYREANGQFLSIEEVKKVEGIKDGVFTKMKEYIVIN